MAKLYMIVIRHMFSKTGTTQSGVKAGVCVYDLVQGEHVGREYSKV